MKYDSESERKALDSMLSEDSGEMDLEEKAPKGDPAELLSKIQSELDELSRLIS